MGNRVEGLNPVILRWARQRAGLSVSEIAQAIQRDESEVASWESGESAPTYVQLEKLAYSVLKRPIAIFFFPNPPEEEETQKAFRTLPASEVERLDPDTRFHIRQAQGLQQSLYELNDGKNPSQRKIFIDLKPSLQTGVVQLAIDVRNYLGVSLEKQCSWQSLDEALKNWRDAIQAAGIYIFKASLKQREISGLCLWDSEFPVIYLNNSTSPSRQIFSIFHELAHLLLHVGGVTKDDDSYIGQLKGDVQKIEVLCNQFASEFLVPDKVFVPLLRRNIDAEYVSQVAHRFKVSREVILRKFLDKHYILQADYEKWVKQWNEDFVARRKKTKGGDYYATKASYLGTKYLELAFARYYQGRLSSSQLADYLNVKATSIPGLEAQLAR